MVLALAQQVVVAAPEDRPAGVRIDLSTGTLFIPEGYRAPNGAHLVVHLHGSARIAEEQLLETGAPAALVTILRDGLSDVYRDCFQDPGVFLGVLDESAVQLSELGIASCGLSRVTLTSFSAGFGGVRELLARDADYDHIDELVMMDSIHTGFVGDPAQRKLDTRFLEGFLRYAREAAEGERAMVITHSEIRPEGYASTTETADWILAQLGGEREAVDEEWAEGWRLTSRYTKGRLTILGFAGDTAEAHCLHVQHMATLLRLVWEEGQ